MADNGRARRRLGALIVGLARWPVVVLIAFDTLSACACYLVGVLVFAPGFVRNNGIVGALGGAFPAVVAAAVLMAPPYIAFVSRSPQRVLSRSVLGGMGYATGVIVLVVLLSWVFGLGSQGPTPDRSLGAVGFALGLMLLLGAPFILLGGAVLGAAHGYLALRLGRPSANTPIVT